MRAHFSPDIPDGDLPVRMNGSNIGAPFGIVGLGHSEICLDSIEDARALAAAAAQIIAWFETAPAPHAFESVHGGGAPFGPCRHCGHISRSELHAEPKPLVISDRTIAQVKAWEGVPFGFETASEAS